MGLVPDDILRQNSIGVNIDVTVVERGTPVNLIGILVKDYIIVKPSETRVVKTASFVTTGADGKLRYITIAGDLNEVGQYRLQADLQFEFGYDGPTEIGTFWVAANL